MEIKSISDLRKAFRHGPYAWPGGYPTYFLMSDGEALSWKGARENLRYLIMALSPTHRDGMEHWHTIALEINWEDRELFCCHYQTDKIPSAYDDNRTSLSYQICPPLRGRT